jgi:hypothetical protein
MRRHAAVSLGLVAALCLLPGCGPCVRDFTATPRHVCAGQEVTVAWDVACRATMTAEPALPGIPNGAVAEHGRFTFTPDASTSIVLHLTPTFGHRTSSTQQVVVGTPVEPLTASLGDEETEPGCDAHSVWATVHAKRFSEEITAATVESRPGDGRTYRVRHGGVEGTVSPGVVAHEFAGRPLAGDWVLTSPLAPGETCGTPTLPRNLGVDVHTQCATGGAP